MGQRSLDLDLVEPQAQSVPTLGAVPRESAGRKLVIKGGEGRRAV